MGPVEALIFLLVFWLPLGVIGSIIMSRKGRSSCGGFALGVVLGPIGLIIALLVQPSEEHEAERQLRIEEIKRRKREKQRWTDDGDDGWGR